jgi:hypothetical protein
MGKIYKFPSGELIETVEMPDAEVKLRLEADAIARVEATLRGMGMNDAADLLHKANNKISNKIMMFNLERYKKAKAKANEAV